MDLVWSMLAVLFVALAIVLIIYGDRSVTSHWVFWIGVVLLVGTFVGIPGAMIAVTRHL
jgi:hypothetical protein